MRRCRRPARYQSDTTRVICCFDQCVQVARTGGAASQIPNLRMTNIRVDAKTGMDIPPSPKETGQRSRCRLTEPLSLRAIPITHPAKLFLGGRGRRLTRLRERTP